MVRLAPLVAQGEGPFGGQGSLVGGASAGRGRQLGRWVELGKGFKKPLLDLLARLEMYTSSSKPQDSLPANIFQTSAQRLRFREVK